MVKKILSILLILLVLVYFSILIFVGSRGKTLLSQKIEEVVGREAVVGSLYIIPPYSIVISHLEIKGLFSVEKLRLVPSIIGFAAGKPGLNKLVLSKPKFSIIRTSDAGFNINAIIDDIKSQQSKTEKKNKAMFFVKEAVIQEGHISFSDELTGLNFTVAPIEAAVVTSLKDFKTRVNLEGQLLSGGKENLGNINLAGWLNFLKKDMEAKFYLDDMDISYFASYFEGFFKKVQSGKLFFTADMVSRDNDLAVNCHLETRDLKFAAESLDATMPGNKIALFGDITGLIFDALAGPEGGGIFDFSIRTKFDKPRLEGLQFKGNIFQVPLKNLLKQAPEERVETIKKIGEDFEAIGKEFKQQFEDIGDAFKKQVEEKTENNTDSQ